MPTMNGRELSDKIQAQLPNLKTLFVSGYIANVIAHRGVLAEGINFISKPLLINALANAIRKILDDGS